MCGLIGAVGNLSQDHRKALWKLLQLDTVRGPHSTGVLARKYNWGKEKNGKHKVDTYYLNKALGTPWDWIEEHHDDFPRGLAPSDTHTFIGHNRWATKGAINVDNAHPFKAEKLVGVHNGTLTQRSIWKLPDSKDYETDSEAIFNSIDNNGLEATYACLEGAWVLIWHDLHKNETYIIKNNQRPLYLAHTTDDKALFWASEDWMLDVAFKQNKIKTKDYFKLDDHTLYTLSTKRNGKATIVKGARFQALPPLQTYYTPPKQKPYMGNSGNAQKHLKLPAPTVDQISIRKGWDEVRGKLLPFFLSKNIMVNGSPIFHGEALSAKHKVRLDMRNHEKEGKFLQDWGEEFWYLGEVSLIAADATSPTGITMTMRPFAITEPLDYMMDDINGNGVEYWDGAYDFKKLIDEKAIVSLSNYVRHFNTLSEDEQIKELEPKEDDKLYRVGNKLVDKEEAEAALLNGCGMCSAVVEVEDIDEVEWAYASDAYVCKKCAMKANIDMMLG